MTYLGPLAAGRDNNLNLFEDQPYDGVVGSIWTLRYEVLCYAGVFLVGLLGVWRRQVKAALALGLYAGLWYWATTLDVLPGILRHLPSLSMPFAVGIAFYVWRDRLPLSLWGVLATAILAWSLSQSVLYAPSMALALSYVTFWLAYIPGGRVRAYNRLGDYSYGIYIYAFPLQGMAVWAFGAQTPWQNMLYAFPPTLLMAILSWHIIEAPSLRAKKPILDRLRGERARVHAMARR